MTPAPGHDIEPYTMKHHDTASARCLTHGTDTAEQWHNPAYAATWFRCDSGQNLRFIITTAVDDTAPVPVMRDLSGLARVVHADAQARAYGTGDLQTRVWLWAGGGQLEELQVTMRLETAPDNDDFQYQRWAVTRADGSAVVTVPVCIDCRA